MHASKLGNLLGLALAALVVVACDSGGDDPPPPADVDLLAGMNGDFSGDNTNRWAFYGPSSSQTVSDCAADGFTGNCLAFTANPFINAEGGAVWDSGLNVKNGASAEVDQAFTLVSGRTYTIRFRARGSVAGMQVNVVLQNPSPWHGFLAQVITLTTTAADYTVSGAADANSTTANIAFQTGYTANAGGTIQIDDIQLMEAQ